MGDRSSICVIFFFNLILKSNSKEEFAEGHSAYFDAVMLGGQQPALKEIMRAQAGAKLNCWPKIGFKAIGCLRMRLSYRNSSNFGSDYACLWLQLLHRYLGPLKVKIYFKGNSKTKTLLNAIRTSYKRVSLIIKPRVAYATGEVSSQSWSWDGRGSVVPILKLERDLNTLRGWAFIFMSTLQGHTLLEAKLVVRPMYLSNRKLLKDYKILAKHWQTCYKP